MRESQTPRSRTPLELAFAGEALRGGTMDAAALGAALVAVEDLFRSADRVVNRARTRLSVEVRAGFRRGSFEVAIEVVQQIASYVPSDLSLKRSQDLVSLLFGTGSVFALVKWLGGTAPISMSKSAEAAVVVRSDGDRIKVRPEALWLSEDERVVRAAEALVGPLELPGIDELEVREGGRRLERVTKSDLGAFMSRASVPQALRAADIAIAAPKEETVDLVVLRPAFERGLKWEMYMGRRKVSVEVRDEEFLGKVEQGRIAFGVGDTLRVRLRSELYETRTRLATRYVVTKVLEVRKGSGRG